MERQLFIIRHGKSSWEDDRLEDIDRPLAERGIRNSDTMARRLLERGPLPELILTSTANRALNTAMIMSGIWGLDRDCLQVHDELYMAYVSEIARVVAKVPKKVARLAIFGHNPSFTLYANTFLDDPIENLPTAGVVIVTLVSQDWERIGQSHVKEVYVDYPKKSWQSGA